VRNFHFTHFIRKILTASLRLLEMHLGSVTLIIMPTLSDIQ